MERLVAMMAFCEAPLDGTVAPSGAAVYGASATGGGNAAANKWPMEKLVMTMAFCEAPFDGTTFDGTSAPSSGAARGDSASFATGGGNLMGSLDAAEKKNCPVERLVATMAFCEAPFDGTFDGTSAPSSSGAAGGSSASAGNLPEAGGGQDAEAKKEWPLRLREPRLMRDKAGTVVDGLAIFETVALD